MLNVRRRNRQQLFDSLTVTRLEWIGLRSFTLDDQLQPFAKACRVRNQLSGKKCRVNRVRPSRKGRDTDILCGNDSFHVWSVDDLLRLQDVFLQAPGGDYVDGPATVQENYLFRGQNFLDEDELVSPQDHFDIAAFSIRLSRVFTTLWMTGYSPPCITSGLPESFPGRTALIVVLKNSTAHTSLEYLVYAVHTLWIIVLFICSALLFVVALLGCSLRLCTPGPDVLGYVGSMMRENKHTLLPPGGTTMDGTQLARVMAETRLRLADVASEDEFGYIA